MDVNRIMKKCNILSIISIIAVISLTGCAAQLSKQNATQESAALKKKAMDYFIEGKVAEAKENFDVAITSYMEALQYDPGSEDIALALSRAFVKERKIRSALYFSIMAVKLNPANPKNWRLLQQLEQLDGNTEKAAEALKMYIKVSPETDFRDTIWLAGYYFDLGREKEAKNILKSELKDDKITASEMSEAADLMAQKGYIEDAQSIYLRIVKRDPMDVKAWIDLGELYEKNNQLEEARKTYIMGHEKNPDSPDLMVLIGNLCLYENDWDCAITYFEKTIAAGVTDTKILKTLCALYFYAGRDIDATAMFDKLKSLGDDDSALYFSLGKAMYYLERFDESDGYYRKGFERVDDTIPEDQLMNAFSGYARTLIRLGRNDDAIALIRDRAGSRIKNQTGVKLLEASIYQDMQRYEDAIAIYEWLLASDPENIHYLLMLGQAYTSSEQYDKAEMTLLKVSKINPDNIRYLIQLSLVYDMTGQFKKAEKSLLSVLELEPKNALALNNLAYMYIEHDFKISKAVEMAQRALSLEPRNGAYHDTLGWGYYMKGNYQNAKKYIEEALKWEDVSGQGVIFDHYGDILDKLGMKNEAINAYQKAIELGEDAQKIQPKLDKLY